MGLKIVFGKDKKERVLKTVKIPICRKKLSEDKKAKDSSGFVLNWEQELGFSGDPFKQEIITPVSDVIANMEKEREALNLFIIEKGAFAMLIGEHSTGKTILLKWLEEQLERYKRDMVINYVEGRELRIEKLQEIMLKPFGYTATKEPIVSTLKQKLGNRRYILIIDGLERLTKEIASFFNTLCVYLEMQLIISSTKELEIPQAKEGEVDYFKNGLKIQLKEMHFDSAAEMVQKRIEKFGKKGLYPFDEELLKKMWDDSKKDTVKLLELCRKQAIGFAIKKSKGENIDDARSYEKEGIDTDKTKIEEKAPEESAKEKERESSYKIEVINRGVGDVIIEEEEKEEEEHPKKKRKYKIRKVKKK